MKLMKRAAIICAASLWATAAFAESPNSAPATHPPVAHPMGPLPSPVKRAPPPPKTTAPPPRPSAASDDTKITLTYGQLKSLISAQVWQAQAKLASEQAQGAIAALQTQLSGKK